MRIEKWKDIAGYEGWYQVSTLGRVKRLKRKFPNHGRTIVVDNERILTPSLAGRGYLVVKIANENGSKRKYVHRLVAEAFIPNTESKPQVDHINRNKTDNRVENLRWATNSENHFNVDHWSSYTAFGETKSLTQWVQTFGVSKTTILNRLNRGWSVEDAVTVKPLKEGERLHGRRKDY